VCLAFGSNARCATISPSPFAMKCEMCLYYEHLPSDEKGNTCNMGASHIWCPCPKILVPASYLATLSNFSKHPSALALLSPQTPSHHHHLPSSIPASKLAAASSSTLELVAASSLASEDILDLTSGPLLDLSFPDYTATTHLWPSTLPPTHIDASPNPRRHLLPTRLCPEGVNAPLPLFGVLGLLTGTILNVD
jgi:hypothetical protein